MVVDYKLVAAARGFSLPPNTLWIVEQIPGYTHSGDVTAFLNRDGNAFWPSYNIPYFEDIFIRRWVFYIFYVASRLKSMNLCIYDTPFPCTARVHGLTPQRLSRNGTDFPAVLLSELRPRTNFPP
jgi:hypothetical protein